MIRLFGIVALATLTGCPLLEVKTDAQEVCVTYHGVSVPGVSADQAAEIDQSFQLDVPDSVAQLASAHADLSFSRAVLHATGDVDLSFAHSASVSVVPVDGSLPVATAASCDDCASSPDTLEIDAGAPFDAVPYVAASPLTVSVHLAGAPPTTSWTMDVDVCFVASVDYKIGS